LTTIFSIILQALLVRKSGLYEEGRLEGLPGLQIGMTMECSQECRDEHGSGLDRAGSGLKPILARSGLDRTAIIFTIGGSGLDRTEKIIVFLM